MTSVGGMGVRTSTLVTVVTLVAVACGGGDAVQAPEAGSSVSGEVVVFAAASLTDAFTDLGAAFTAAHPDASVTFNFAGSSELVAQITEGAPADVFASADPANMANATDAGAAASEPATFATNRAEIVVAAGNPLGITAVDDLADDDLIVVVCSPQVPCGTYAHQIFERAGIEPSVESYEENVRAVLGKVVLGEADAGIVYATDVSAAGDAVGGVGIGADVNVVARYPIAVTAEAPNPHAAQAFVDLVLGPDGQAILADHGFGAP